MKVTALFHRGTLMFTLQSEPGRTLHHDERHEMRHRVHHGMPRRVRYDDSVYSSGRIMGQSVELRQTRAPGANRPTMGHVKRPPTNHLGGIRRMWQVQLHGRVPCA